MKVNSDSNGFDTKPIKIKRKMIVCRLSIFFIGMLILQGCNSQNDMNVAVKKVSELFVVGDYEAIKEGKSGKIKDSTDQQQINEALEAIDTINTNDDIQSEEAMLIFPLITATLYAQSQLSERDGTMNSPNSVEQDEDEVEEYYPDEDDIMYEDYELKNKQTLEDFMNIAGENGKDNESEIRVVKDEGDKGVLIYDLKSRYDKNADQSWIEVIPDKNYFSPSDDDTQDVFNNAPQQCNFLSKDEVEGFYKLHECRTHWEYRLFPIRNDDAE